jgi:hypothetical protein
MAAWGTTSGAGTAAAREAGDGRFAGVAALFFAGFAALSFAGADSFWVGVDELMSRMSFAFAERGCSCAYAR